MSAPSRPPPLPTTVPCPCCGFSTLLARGGDEVCPVCFWEDDGQDNADSDEVRGGPNGALSLDEARANFLRHGAADPDGLHLVRSPAASERRGRRFALIGPRIVELPVDQPA